MQSSLFFFTEPPVFHIIKNKKKDRSRYKVSHRQTKNFLFEATASLQGFSLVSWPSFFKPKRPPMIFVSQSMLNSFNQDQAENWLENILPRDKPHALNELFSASLRNCQNFGQPSPFLDKEISTEIPACSWLIFAAQHAQKQSPDLSALFYTPTDVIGLVLPFLSPRSLNDVALVALRSSRPRLLKKVLPYLAPKQILSQNSYLLQSCSMLTSSEASTKMLEMLIPVSNWRKAVGVLINNAENESADRLLSNPLVPASDLEGVLSFAKYKGVNLPNAQAKYEKHLLKISLHNKSAPSTKKIM